MASATSQNEHPDNRQPSKFNSLKQMCSSAPGARSVDLCGAYSSKSPSEFPAARSPMKHRAKIDADAVITGEESTSSSDLLGAFSTTDQAVS